MLMKIGIIGASGTVGSCAAFGIASQGLARELVLFDINRNLVKSHQMDLEAAVSHLHDIKVIVAQEIEDLSDSDVVIIAASAPWRQIKSRMDLLEANLPVVESISEAVGRYCPNSILINVTNPVDLLNSVVKLRSGLSQRQCLGYSLNDTIRFKRLLASRLGVSGAAVDAFVIGEHGDYSVPLFSSVKVHGVPLQLSDSACEDVRIGLSRILQEFESLATGRTSGWTSAVGICSIVRAISEGAESIYPCSVWLDGQYGMSGFSATVPVRLDRRGVAEFGHLQLSDKEEEQLMHCLKVLEKTTRSLGYY
jgi:L-lactate dehydrogenase